jgi:hypothetical protein
VNTDTINNAGRVNANEIVLKRAISDNLEKKDSAMNLHKKNLKDINDFLAKKK